MLRLCCCPAPVGGVAPAPAPACTLASAPPLARQPLALDLVADLPPHTRDSSAFTSYDENDKQTNNQIHEKIPIEVTIVGDVTDVDNLIDEVDEPPPPPHSPSIRVEDYSEKSNPSLRSVESRVEAPSNVSKTSSLEELRSQKSLDAEPEIILGSGFASRKSSPVPSKSKSAPSTPAKSRNQTPDPTSDVYNERPQPSERDVRNALAECIVPARHEDWEVIVNGLVEMERLTIDPTARAPAASWRAAVRSAAVHVRSLRSRVARTACCTLGALFEHRGRALDPELEEATVALLERCADVNRFLRADAATALVRLARGSNGARAAVALSRRGATHRAGPVRAAAAQALARLVQQTSPSRILELHSEPRTVVLRAAGELLGDANAETRMHARHLCLALSEDPRFRQMLKEAMSPSRYRAIEKYLDKLRYH